ncbi:hypothetical protein DEO72_LG1g2358 [Vigna unguiculata]|uniref:Uncharacterized protein n=1 Tax=Vigna unguiculata TaxID=3917 RepID=A0A4D6KMG9_VIGUN|nr:hypothetical protein DEO72_LG1g2358 [Vigna unguiculata]
MQTQTENNERNESKSQTEEVLVTVARGLASVVLADPIVVAGTVVASRRVYATRKKKRPMSRTWEEETTKETIQGAQFSSVTSLMVTSIDDDDSHRQWDVRRRHLILESWALTVGAILVRV